MGTICHVVSVPTFSWELEDQGTCDWITYLYNVGDMQDYPNNNGILIHILKAFLEQGREE